MTDSPLNTALRTDWLRVLALADPQALQAAAEPVLKDYAFSWLRRPEAGLTMVRARIGNSGDRFNLGEATVTRCAVRWQPPQGPALAGVGYVMGRDEARAERIAQLDALLQSPALHALVWQAVVQPLREQLQAAQQRQREQAEATRVRFFTLQPEAAA